MLVLSRKKSEAIVIDGKVTIRIVGIKGTKVRLGIEAPKEVPILREELERRSPLRPIGVFKP